MTPELMAALVARWVWLYTLGLPAEVRERRAGEIAADVHDQIAHERARGTRERRIALAVLSRTARGAAADASWRVGADRSLVAVALVTAALLSVPLVAMPFSDEVVWTPFDFLVAGVLIGGAGLVLRAIVRRARDLTSRAAAALALAAVFALVWGNLAVGMVGEPGEPVNALYLAVLAVAVLGTVTARLRLQGMARTFLATAVVQAVVAAIVLIAGEHEGTGSSAAEVLVLNGLFAALFLGSALLFRQAALTRPRLGPRPQE